MCWRDIKAINTLTASPYFFFRRHWRCFYVAPFKYDVAPRKRSPCKISSGAWRFSKSNNSSSSNLISFYTRIRGPNTVGITSRVRLRRVLLATGGKGERALRRTLSENTDGTTNIPRGSSVIHLYSGKSGKLALFKLFPLLVLVFGRSLWNFLRCSCLIQKTCPSSKRLAFFYSYAPLFS